ncbi:unnamed protein product [Nesidiocoris tenuis]|uniref:Uncharacterized protein n=1 Tax=Nesidiocoris tenuis TaxID=355587 RepID=A0A6H5GK14_9HEMI|nr:unnamed protein product [Nesidiocoris tenuis]
MGDKNVIQKYEDLLKPVTANIYKNWSMSLTDVLNDFLSRNLHDDFATNFPEAAILLQNSTTFYCKRVDAVFQIMGSLTSDVSTLLIMDLLTFKHAFPSLPYFIFRNRLPSSARLLYFWCRIFGRSWYGGGPIISQIGDDGAIDDRPARNWKEGDDIDINIDVGLNGCNGILSDGAADDMDDSPAEVNGSLEPITDENANTAIEEAIQKMKAVTVQLHKHVDWEPLNLKFVYPAVLKRRRVFQLPKNLIEEASQVREIMEKKRMKLEQKLAKKAEIVSNGVENNHEPHENGADIDDTNHFDESVDPLRGSDPNSEEILENSPGTSAAGTSDEMAKFQQHRIEDSLAASVRLKNIGSFAESVWPKIVDAERRKYFSVHEYGTKVLDTFSNNSEEFKDFGEIVKDKPANEIAMISSECRSNFYLEDCVHKCKISENVRAFIIVMYVEYQSYQFCTVYR